jgi:signal transduction histidine kinase
MTATGGIESPAAPGVMLMIVLASILASGRAAWAIFVTGIAVFAIFSTVQTLGWFPDSMPRMFGGAKQEPVPALALIRGLALTLMTSGVFLVVTRVRQAYERLSERMDAAGRALADRMADENRTLGLLTGEIAHELKNPLASVKGLAGLVAKDLDGRAAERMVVLRREVDRMQQILEQFLTLSRPIVPLDVAEVDLGELCAEVVALHEGVAAERGVALELRAARGLTTSADARKLLQVLVNLVQNALEATPRGRRIAIHAAREEGAPVLRVLDEGPGLAPDVAGRAFESGVTTKAEGSGLGLAIARSLARQHGGEVELAAREGGGVAAIVRLP